MHEQKFTSRTPSYNATAQSRFQFDHHPLRRMVVAVMLTLGVAAAGTACGFNPGQEGRMAQSGTTGVTTDPATIAEALRFGGIVLPPSAKVLGVQYDKGIDQRYRLAIAVDPESIDTLLSGSGFATPLEPDSGPFMAPVEGFDLTSATAVSFTDDTLAPQGERTSTVFRRVAVDRSNSAKPIVHVWLFTT